MTGLAAGLVVFSIVTGFLAAFIYGIMGLVGLIVTIPFTNLQQWMIAVAISVVVSAATVADLWAKEQQHG